MHSARIPPVDQAPATITAVLAMHAGHIRPSSELEVGVSSLGLQNPKIVILKIEDLIDSRFVRKLDESGLIDRLYGAESGR